MQELETYITSYFGIPKDELTKVVNAFTPIDYQKGDFFCKKDHYCNKLSFVSSGYFRVSRESGTKDITQWISGPGYMLTDLASLVFDQPARWNIQALSDATTYAISKEDYNNIGKHVPEWNKLEKLFLAKCFMILEDRVYQQLSMSAEEKYDALFEQNKEIFNQVPLQYLASMMGMSPETLSRIRKNKTS